MTSGASNSNGSLSQPSSSKGKAPVGKMKVIVQQDGSIVGENSKIWNTRTGDFVRIHIPIHYRDWRGVPPKFKDDVWQALMVEFELNVPPEVARPLIERTWSQKFRTYKNSLRGYLKNNVEPKGVDPDIWKKFVQNESDPKKQQQNLQNAQNRAKFEFSHCLGRRTYAQKQYLMEKDDPEKPVRRVNKWLAGHEHRNGNILESAKRKYEEVKAAEEKRRNLSMDGEGCNGSLVDLDNDALAEVFGKDKNGGIRGVGSNISKKQLIHAGVAMAKLEQSEKENTENRALKDEMNHLRSRIDDVYSLVEAVFTKMSNAKESSPPIALTPRSELGSNSVHCPLKLVQNLENVFATVGASPSQSMPTRINNTPVILCSKFGKELAKGYLVTDATAGICHFKPVANGDKKDYIKEVLEPEAELWDAPQDGHNTFAGFVDGGFLTWPECWLKYA